MNFKSGLLAIGLSVSLLTAQVPTIQAEAGAPTSEAWLSFAGQGDLEARLIARYSSGAAFEEGGTEIVAYDSLHQQMYSVNGAEKALDIISISSLSSAKSKSNAIHEIKLTKRISLEQLSKQSLSLSDITSVAIHPSNEYVAIAAPADPVTDAGYIIFIRHDGTYLNHVQVGVLPDMVTFTPDGKHVLAANEGQPNDDYTIDPVGSVSIINVEQGVQSISASAVTTAGFDKVEADGIRIVKPGASFSEDAEPEYIVVADDSSKAYVALQESNAIAVLDLKTKQITDVHDLGVIDHSLPGYALDASDKDGVASLKNWPVLGMFMPDGMSMYTVDGKSYILTANEGDAKDYDGFSEEARVKDLADRIALDASYYKGFTQEQLDAMAETMFADEQLGRLKTTTSVALNKDGKQEAIYSYGTRSFSIWDADTMELVFDSGDQFERITKLANPAGFNTDNAENSVDSRSDDKGVEPEAVTVGKVGDTSYAFVGLERAGGIMAYDLSNPAAPVFDLYFSSRSYDADEEIPSGDVAPEGLTFIEASNSPTGEALLLVANELSGTIAIYELTESDQIRLQIVATNDIHSRVYEDGGMGYAKIATIVEQARAINPNTIVLDAGDTLHGQTFSTLVEGSSIIELMNEIGYAAMTTGNHDYNYGSDRLHELGEQAAFPILAANVKKTDGSYAYEPYVVKEMDGIKLGIFGIATPETVYKTHPNNVAGITFTDPATAAQEMVNTLKDKADVIINLAHLGTDGSTIAANRSDAVAEKVDGIDVVIDGHSHELINRTVNDALLVQFGEYGEQVGIITLVLEDGKLVDKQSHYITADDASTLPAHPEVAALVKKTTEAQQVILDQVIGKTDVKLIGEREVVRTGESNLGNLITDAMVASTGADAAITNGGGIRASIEAGEITKGDVITVLPFGNFIVTIEVTGQELKDALEVGAGGYPAAKGAFTHVSGITYKIDPEAEAGDRVHSVTVNGKALELNRTYTLATNDFLAAGGDEYTMLADNTIINNAGTLDEELIRFIQKQDTISPQVEQRIVVEAKQKDSSKPAAGGNGNVTNETVAEKPAKPSNNANNSSSSNNTGSNNTQGKPAAQVNKYIVKKGDTLSKIARQHKTTWQRLQQVNKLKNPHLIYPGQQLIILSP
ncbi:choice-of-anchor I family protein [Paenibacillus camelliae]|uniref:choice-of-anchor I family protein n=1 Tax=Paenibacillus camelliae TaxID=512410 RepID=UPI0020400D64|nr:choice-of-anchor I family protein [Paenibacillus camelliae]MCM3634544.1 choice-of-anchor I family protein [Paenibacillus camelliae]